MNSASGSQGPSVSSTDSKEGNHTGKFKNPGKVLIVTNVHDQVFEDDSIREQFEKLFRDIDPESVFHYLSGFKRARVEMTNLKLAVTAKVHTTGMEICGQAISSFFLQSAQQVIGSESSTLQVPIPERQFLISPPVSVPEGWEPDLERKPGVDYDLLSAVSNLAPGEAFTLVEENEDRPSIEVHVSETPAGHKIGVPIPHTQRPTSE